MVLLSKLNNLFPKFYGCGLPCELVNENCLITKKPSSLI